jgi:Ca2+-binding RTX toxin-like protein
MATLDFSKATASVFMSDASLVGFDTVEIANPDLWSFFTPGGHDLEVRGQGLTYDAQGHAVSGTVNSIAIDVGNNDVLNPDLLITGINVAASTLDDSPESFWRLLDGNDVFTLPSVASDAATFFVFGDADSAPNGAATGGHDTIRVNGAEAWASGDVFFVGSQTAGAPAARYQGGSDSIHGSATNAMQILAGDSANVSATGRLTGGNDNIRINTVHAQSWAIGDVDVAAGIAGDVAEVFGGNDYIEAGINSNATLVGDVTRQFGHSVVRGGNDEMVGGGQGEVIVGDVFDVGSDRMTGGDDTIWGNGGGDVILGDALKVAAGGKVVAGNDTIYGGDGHDYIYGDTSASSPSVTGGNDELNGDAGDDFLYGGGGDDFLHGGTGKDEMRGGAGNDTYVVDDAGDMVLEAAGQGIDTVKALVEVITLSDHVEHLSSVWIGSLTAYGNDLGNIMTAGAGYDQVEGMAGNDVLVGYGGDDALLGGEGSDTLRGGEGFDILDGGNGTDTASYEGAMQGVKVALDGSFVAQGEALGDTFTSVERLIGSDHRDALRGDANANVIWGGGGNDALQGAAGNDTLVGGAGKDGLLGGAGDDRFDFLALADGGDTVADFGNVAGNNDALRFEGDVFGGLPNGALTANRFVANAAGVATSLDQRFVYETDTGILRYDANGSAAGGVTVIATLTGAPTLTAGDIFVF